MKKPLLASVLLISTLIILNSCATSSITKAKYKADLADSKEVQTTCFVQMNDGTIRNYNTLKLVTSPFSTPYLLADGNIKIRAKQITAYQNNDHYAVSQKIFCCGRKSAVAVETLPGFAVRTVKGKLNLYSKKYFNGQVAVDEYFVQVNDGKIFAYSPELLNTLLKDNSEAYNFFNNKNFKGTMPEKIHATAHLYNNGQLMSKN